MRVAVGQVAKPETIEPSGCRGSSTSARPPERSRPERDVLDHGEVGKQQVLLKHVPDASLFDGESLDAAGTNRDASRAVDETSEVAERRGLAGPVRANERERLAGLDEQFESSSNSPRASRIDASRLMP